MVPQRRRTAASLVGGAQLPCGRTMSYPLPCLRTLGTNERSVSFVDSFVLPLPEQCFLWWCIRRLRIHMGHLSHFTWSAVFSNIVPFDASYSSLVGASGLVATHFSRTAAWYISEHSMPAINAALHTSPLHSTNTLRHISFTVFARSLYFLSDADLKHPFPHALPSADMRSCWRTFDSCCHFFSFFSIWDL